MAAPSLGLLVYFVQMSSASYPLPPSHRCSHSRVIFADATQTRPLSSTGLWLGRCCPRKEGHAVLWPVQLFTEAWPQHLPRLLAATPPACSSLSILNISQLLQDMLSVLHILYPLPHPTAPRTISYFKQLFPVPGNLTVPLQSIGPALLLPTRRPHVWSTRELVHSDFSSISTPFLPYMT